MRVSLVLLICFSLSLCFVSGDNHVGNVEILFSKGNNKNFGMGVSPKPLKIQGESKKEVRDDDSPGPCKEEKFSVTETAFDTPIQTFLWSPYETNHVWVITEERALFMSKDGGGDGWERILTEVDYIFEGTKGEVLYAINRTHLMSTEDFLSWNHIELPFHLNSFEVHPTEPKWAAAVFPEGEDCDDRSPKRCAYVLKYTKNANNWVEIGSSVTYHTWGAAGSFGIPKESLVFTETGGDLLRMTDLNEQHRKWQVLLKQCAGVFYLNKVLLGVCVRDNRGQIFESRDQGTTFTYPRLPEEISGNFAMFLEGPDFISYLQDESGQLFESSEDGTTYSLLLRDVVLSNERVTGYTNLESLLGNFVANVKVTSEYSAGVNWKTLISHEMGSEWFPLPVPEGISCVEAAQDCSLNLYGMESGYPILAQEQTSGVIVANGHEGDFLVEPPKASRTQVFLSRDSGFTFEKIADRSHYFGLGDHGGVLVMVETEETQDLKFSENQGEQVQACRFTEKEEVVFGDLYSEPKNKGLRFLAVGVREMGDGVEAGIVVQVNFHNYFERECSDDDYELYTPINMEGDECLLGQKHSFLRRKRDADCYSNVAFETEINATICECERDDYVCDYCFELEAETETCVKSELGECSDYDPYAPPEDCEEYFQVPTGYRKVPRNNCEANSVDPWEDNEWRPCNDTHHHADDDDNKHHTDSGTNYFIFFYVLVAGIIVLLVGYKVTPIRKFFSSLLPQKETEDELFGESYKTVDAANAVSLLDSDEESGQGGDDELFSGGNDEDAFLFGPDGGEGGEKGDDLFGGEGEKGDDPAGLL